MVGLLEENIKLIYAIMNYTENKQTSGLNIHIDFEKKNNFWFSALEMYIRDLDYFNFNIFN